MPRIDTIAATIEKKSFKKKNYRPWDLLGDFGPPISLPSPDQVTEENKIIISETEQIDTNKASIREHVDVNKVSIEKQSDNKKISIGQHLDINKITKGEQIDNIKTSQQKNTEDKDPLYEQQLDINKISTALKLDNNGVSKRQHIDNIKETIREQTDTNKITKGEQIDNKEVSSREQLDNIKETIRYPIREQKNQCASQKQDGIRAVTIAQENKETTDYLDAILRLSGHQKKLFFFVLDCCISKGLLSTGNVSIETLKNALETIDYGTIKICIHRLVEKGLILRERGKRGRGGFNRFRISETIRNSALEYRRITHAADYELNNKKITIREQLDIQLDNKRPLSSSGNLNTTTTKGEGNDLPPDWHAFDFSPLEEIGFGKAHVLQIQRRGLLDLKTVQESVHAFAFDLKRNQKAKTLTKGPLEFFMGILGKGYPYAPPENYESPKDEAMRLYTERLQALKEKREQTEKQATELAFEEWAAALTKEERNKIIPGVVGMKNENAKRASLIHHFRENVWPEMKELVAGEV